MSLEGKLLRKGGVLKNVATLTSQKEKRGKSKGKKIGFPKEWAKLVNEKAECYRARIN